MGKGESMDFCLHHVEVNKCYEGCAAKAFKSKGLDTVGACDTNIYKETDAKKVVQACSNGVTNLKYCTKPLYPVSITQQTKGKTMTKVSTATEVVPLVDEVDPIACGGTDAKLAVTNKLRPSMKFRTCTKSVDPKTGWACNHGTPFTDCARRVNQGEDAELDLPKTVQTILPITFTAQGAVDMVSRCYWVKPAGGWPTAGVVLDEAWWNKLQKS